MSLQRLMKFIFFSFLFWFDYIEAGKSFAEQYRFQKSKGNYHLESTKICRQTRNVKAAVCSLVFRYLNKKEKYKNQDKLLHLNYFHIQDVLFLCEKTPMDTGDTQIMMSCEGRHQPVHFDITDDYYRKEIKISHGFKKNDIIIYKLVRMLSWKDDYFIPWFSMSIQWNTLVPAKEELFKIRLQAFQYAYIVNENEAELKYFRLMTGWYHIVGNRDQIHDSGTTALRLFHICSTIIQNTYLRSIIEMDWNLIPEVLTPVISKVVTQYDNTYYDEIIQKVGHVLYSIPGSSNHYYKVSSGLLRTTLIFYKWVNTEVGEYVVEIHKPILIVDNVIFNERPFMHNTGSNSSSTNNSPKSSSERIDSPRSSSEEDM